MEDENKVVILAREYVRNLKAQAAKANKEHDLGKHMSALTMESAIKVFATSIGLLTEKDFKDEK